jgi:hypothetical protein
VKTLLAIGLALIVVAVSLAVGGFMAWIDSALGEDDQPGNRHP